MTGKLFDIAKALVLAATLGMCGWIFNSVVDIQERLATMETKQEQDPAQWDAINDVTDQLRSVEIETAVMTRLMQILLDQNKIDIRVLGKEKPQKGKEEQRVLEILPRRKPSSKEFQDERMRRYEQQQQAK